MTKEQLARNTAARLFGLLGLCPFGCYEKVDGAGDSDARWTYAKRDDDATRLILEALEHDRA